MLILTYLFILKVLFVSGQPSSQTCFTMSDITFLVSTSNQDADVATAIKSELTDFIGRFPIAQSETRVALATSGRYNYISFYLDTLPNRETAENAIEAAPFITQGEKPDLLEEIEVVRDNILSAINGDRPNVTNIWFIITETTPETFSVNTSNTQLNQSEVSNDNYNQTYNESSIQQQNETQDETQTESYMDRLETIIHELENEGSVFYFVSITSLEEARLWSPYATHSDFTMDLAHMELLVASMVPYVQTKCIIDEKPAEPEKDELCLQQSCDECRSSENHVAVCSCDGFLGSKYCYTEQPTQTEDTTRARCRSGEGITDSTVILINGSCHGAAVHTICPGFGPESGGTDVYIWGGGFGENLKAVYLRPFECNVVFQNDTFIHCISSDLDGSNAHSSYLSLQVDTLNGCRMRTPGAYVYYHNPRIRSVQPKVTILSGGFITSVIGDNLINVANLILEVTAVYEDQAQLFASKCTVANENVAECFFPEISLPEMNDRQTDSKASSNSSSTARRKRQTFTRREKQEILDKYSFYMGFKIDGINMYKNLSSISVYLDPVIESFPEDPLGNNAVNYNPDVTSFITIKGQGLNVTTNSVPLVVTVGNIGCNVVNVTNNHIIFTPPSDKPPTPTVDDLYIVNVHISQFKRSPGFIRYNVVAASSEDDSSSSQTTVIIIIVIVVLVILIVGIIAYLYIRRRRKQKNKKKDWNTEHGYVNTVIDKQERNKYLTAYSQASHDIVKDMNHLLVGEYLDPNRTIKAALSGDLKANVIESQLDPVKVEKGRLLSRGNHGLIYTGWLVNEDKERLAKLKIKTFDFEVPFRHTKEFLTDATKLKGLDHENVLPFAGIILEDRIPTAVTQSAEFGIFKNFLMDYRKIPEKLSLKEKLKFCINICDGMQYMMEKGVVHEDLATRNCVVDTDYVIKVADSTLSRDFYELEYYRPGEKAKALPVKWMAPEALEHELFTSKGDVWSFGVVMWEVFTLAATPYPDVQNSDIRNHIRTGVRLEKPESTPVTLYAEMLHCWAKEPNKRPGFRELTKILQNFSTEKPTNTQSSLLPLEHFAITDATVTSSFDSGVPVDENSSTNSRKSENGSQDNSDVRNTDNGDTKL